MPNSSAPAATGEIIDGVALAGAFRANIAARVEAIKKSGRIPGRVRLDAVLADSGDSAARVYADNQARTCEMLGIEYKLHTLHAGAGYDDLAGRVLLLNTDDDVTAIMVHLPLPEGIEPYRIQRLIAPEKDVEGVNPANIGNVVYGRSSLAPCTALAVIKMLEHVYRPGRTDATTGATLSDPFLRGKVAVVVGAGDVVGKPIAVLLMRQEATVISCNKWSPELATLAKRGDIVIAAAGVPGLIGPEMVKSGAVVVDVGVNRVKGADGKTKTVGDVRFDEVRPLCSRISPVPGGVGPMTVAMLLLNVVEATERR